MDRISTGIKGLDEMLCGGLIPNRPYAVTGPPGSGKTTLGIHFLMEGIRNEEDVVLVALDEPPNEIKANAQAFGLNLGPITILDAVPGVKGFNKNIHVKDIGTVLDIHTMRDVRGIRPSMSNRAIEVSIHSVQKMLKKDMDYLHATTGQSHTRVVIDSITALRMFGMKGEDQRILIQSFIRFLAEMEVTALIITQAPRPDELDTEVYLARGEIRLYKWRDDGGARHGVGIEKFRGSHFDELIRPMNITSSGIEVQSQGSFLDQNSAYGMSEHER